MCSLDFLSRPHRVITLAIRPGCFSVVVAFSLGFISSPRYVSMSVPDVMLNCLFKCEMMVSI